MLEHLDVSFWKHYIESNKDSKSKRIEWSSVEKDLLNSTNIPQKHKNFLIAYQEIKEMYGWDLY